jgi:hypothetical protein
LGHLKISKTTGPEKIRLAWKLSDIVQIQICSNHGPGGSVRDTIWKTIFAYDYI